MKTLLMIAGLLAIAAACSDTGSSRRHESLVGADTGTQADLIGDWQQNCQIGQISSVGFAALAGMNRQAPAEYLEIADTGTTTGTGQDQGSSKSQDQSLPTSTTTTTMPTTTTTTTIPTTTTTTTVPTTGAAGIIESFQTSISISEKNLVIKTKGFNSMDCSGNALLESQVEMSYQIPSYQPGTLSNLDATVTSAVMTLNSQEAVQIANLSALCGFRKWQVSAPMDLAGSRCHAAQLKHSVGQILNYQNGNLFFGAEELSNARASSATRPTTLIKAPLTLASPRAAPSGVASPATTPTTETNHNFSLGGPI